jgi:hypothetical protein
MNVLEISYDLRSPGRNYAPLYQAIKSYSVWCHPLDSTWLVPTNDNAASVRDKLAVHLDRNDGMLVTVLTGEAAWIGLSDEISQWLQQRLSAASRY